MTKELTLGINETLQSFKNSHGVHFKHPRDLTSENPDGYYTRDGGYMRVDDNPHYDTVVRTGAFALLFAGPQMLLVTPPWTPRTLEIPGGGVKGNETIDCTILRELTEETGFEPDLEKSDIFAQAQFYMNLTAEDAHCKFLKYTMIMKAIDITPTLARHNKLETMMAQYKPEESGNVRYVININNRYDIDAIIQSHDKLMGSRLGHHLFIRKTVEKYRQLNMDISPSTTLSKDVPNGLIREIKTHKLKRQNTLKMNLS